MRTVPEFIQAEEKRRPGNRSNVVDKILLVVQAPDFVSVLESFHNAIQPIMKLIDNFKGGSQVKAWRVWYLFDDVLALPVAQLGADGKFLAPEGVSDPLEVIHPVLLDVIKEKWTDSGYQERWAIPRLFTFTHHRRPGAGPAHDIRALLDRTPFGPVSEAMARQYDRFVEAAKNAPAETVPRENIVEYWEKQRKTRRT